MDFTYLYCSLVMRQGFGAIRSGRQTTPTAASTDPRVVVRPRVVDSSSSNQMFSKNYETIRCPSLFDFISIVMRSCFYGRSILLVRDWLRTFLVDVDKRVRFLLQRRFMPHTRLRKTAVTLKWMQCCVDPRKRAAAPANQHRKTHDYTTINQKWNR